MCELKLTGNIWDIPHSIVGRKCTCLTSFQSEAPHSIIWIYYEDTTRTGVYFNEIKVLDRLHIIYLLFK